MLPGAPLGMGAPFFARLALLYPTYPAFSQICKTPFVFCRDLQRTVAFLVLCSLLISDPLPTAV